MPILGDFCGRRGEAWWLCTEKYEKKEMQDRVRELFDVLMQRKEGEDFLRIDASSSLEDVQEKVKGEVDRCIEQVDKGNMPLRTVEEW
jgi:dTMP kinase